MKRRAGGALFFGALAVGVGAAELVAPTPDFDVGPPEILATAAQREALGLHTFFDGNLGVLAEGETLRFYGANGGEPVRVSGSRAQPFQTVERVTIQPMPEGGWNYQAGGPVYRDPESHRLLLFYHAELHRGSAAHFYSVLGAAIQTDKAGLIFQDLGPLYTPHLPVERADRAVEVCGAPFVIRAGCFYLYARDVLDGDRPQLNNLIALRAPVVEVLARARVGRAAEWRKYHEGRFDAPGRGGRSTALEVGNPLTRWMDVSYNTALQRCLMIVAAPAATGVAFYVSQSVDGLMWTPRNRLLQEPGELFYLTMVDGTGGPRETGREFDLYYTASATGEWGRWRDAKIIRRKISVRPAETR